MNDHHFLTDQYGSQSCEIKERKIFFAYQEERQYALLPEVGAPYAISDNLKTTDVIAWQNGLRLRTDHGKWLLQVSERLANIVGIALNTRHGLREKSSVNIYHRGALMYSIK